MSTSESMYRNIVENNADAILVLKGREVIYANQKVADVYGTNSPDDIIGTSITQYVTADELVKLAQLEQMPSDNPELSNVIQFNGVHKNGTLAIHEVSISRSEFENEPVIILTIRDVTERKESEHKIMALHTSTALIGMATNWDQVADAVLLALNEIMHLTYASVGLVVGSELAFTHHLGESTVSAMPLDGEGITVRAINSKKTQYVPDTRKDSSYVSSRESGDDESLSEIDVPVIVDNKAVAIINVEDHIVDSFSEEERYMIEILGVHISSAIQRMDHEKQMALIRESHLMEMVGGIDKICERVQNDLKGPIHSMKNTSFLIRHNPELVGELIDNLDSSLRLIEDTLGEMKEITSPTEPENKLTDVYALLDQSITLSTIPRNIKLVKNYTEGFLAVSLDEEKIKRVFYNLMRNSIESMGKGGTISITISVEAKMVVFEFKDTGTGIPESIMRDIFTPFYSTKPNSLGLGLSFCKLAVESNGGELQLESKIDEGTTVTVKLPL